MEEGGALKVTEKPPQAVILRSPVSWDDEGSPYVLDPINTGILLPPGGIRMTARKRLSTVGEPRSLNPMSSSREPKTRAATRDLPSAGGQAAQPDGATTVTIPEPLLSKLYGESRAERFGLTQQDFAGILHEVAGKYLRVDAKSSEGSEFLASLRVEELALARACARGDEAAWEIFLNRFREKLYSAAYSIAREDSAGRELADSLYADLFGTRTTDGRRISKLNSYTGRGSLEGWLRAVLGQEYVNRYRRQQRLVSLEEQTEAGAQFQAAEPDPAQALDARVEAATDQALASLAAEDKFILASYYLDGSTLAEVARVLGVHESTVSRKLEKITASIRKSILAGLRERGMSRKEAEQAMDVEVSEFSLDVRRRLTQEKGEQTVP
jgi:RNA polymerase sigma-70 factor (ECF subfamily)